MKDELHYRRDGFVDGANIVLADGQAWSFRPPIVRRAYSSGDRGFAVRVANLEPELSAKFQAALADYDSASSNAESWNVDRLAATELTLAACLLLANYSLTDDELGELLQFSYRDAQYDPEGHAIREAVMGVVFGSGSPKASAVGDD